MTDELYQRELLRLAADATGAGHLSDADATVTLDNPLCGDRITLQLKLDDNKRVIRLAHAVRACLLCQAAASAIGAHAPGHSAADLKIVADGLAAMLKQGVPISEAPQWHADLVAFQPVAEHRSRHSCVLLPFEALIKALEQSGGF